MPPNTAYWTRKLELELIEFIREREYVWKAVGNTNHDIQLKYQTYTEFAARLGPGFTASAVRDRWVNIRSTFNHNVRKIQRSPGYVPCWPLWEPLQFLQQARHDTTNKKDTTNTEESSLITEPNAKNVKIEIKEDFGIRQRGPTTTRPRRNVKKKRNKCIKVLNNLIEAMNPLLRVQHTSYYFFGKHVVERLNCMRDGDAECAVREIMNLITDDGHVEYLLPT